MEQNFTYKIASEPAELEQIYKLNYETFVEEIPQHEKNKSQYLIDKFDEENVYMIAKDREEVIGMIAVRANRPFSLDFKIDNLDGYLPKHVRPCEIRLLTVKRKYRKSRVFYHLVNLLVSYCLNKKYDLALISGTDRQIRLYKKIGFEPFGPLVGTEGAMFQPMYLTEEKFETYSIAFSKMMKQKKNDLNQINFLPGPVAIKKDVEQAFRKTVISHRDEDFTNVMKSVRERLCKLVHANHAQVIVGTQIKKIPGKGLILANGEFGYRLFEHADRLGLQYYKLEKQWNEHISIKEIEGFLKAYSAITWIWTVHCETSTGYLYDLNEIKKLSEKYQIKVCVDACSSVGVVPIDLQGVYLASAVSGKGIGSYPGLSIVFHQEEIVPDKEIPRYLDLGQYAIAASIPYTHSSNLIFALLEALKSIDFENSQMLATTANRMLKNAGYSTLGNEEYSPGIITIQLPKYLSSKVIGDTLKEKGIMISYESEYLLKRNWIQFAFMGDVTLKEFEVAFAILKTTVSMVERASLSETWSE